MQTEELYKVFLKAENGITTDTRACGEGMLFFALKGENYDGNQFAHEALKSGCIAAVVDDASTVVSNQIILVDDVLEALQNLAKYHRRTFKDIPVMGLTGSNGKTTVKELTAAVLAKKYKVHATKGNLNNHIGVPLTILSTPRNCQFLLIEIGANHLGEIANLARIVEPNVGIITNIGLAHLEGFGGEEGVKKGKKELFDYLREVEGARVFVHGDHDKLMEVSEGLERSIFGTKDMKPFVRYEMEGGRKFVWSEQGYESEAIGVQLGGDYNLDNIAAAITIGRYFGVDREEVGEAISEYVPANNRSQVVKTESNKILLDAYNANPSSMEKALESFAKNNKGERLVILGDMRELGEFSIESHKKVVAQCAELGLDGVFVGTEFYKVNQLGVNSGKFYKEIDGLVIDIEDNKVKGKNILLKGSRGMAMERLLPHL
jgi:UDP-N-acetylmuramoyl-tripeptide--D-alanyl-D-alanine ligase